MAGGLGVAQTYCNYLLATYLAGHDDKSDFQQFLTLKENVESHKVKDKDKDQGATITLR